MTMMMRRTMWPDIVVVVIVATAGGAGFGVMIIREWCC